MKVKLIAKKPLKYAGKRLAVGDLFFATGQSDARALKGVGLAGDAPVEAVAPVYVPPVVEPVKRTYVRKVAEPEPDPEPVKPKRTYLRRDLKAE